MNMHTPTNDNAAPTLRRRATILEREADFRRLRGEWLAHSARWDPLHAAAIRTAEDTARALGVAGAQQWQIAIAVSDASGATAAGEAGDVIEKRMCAAIGDVIDTPARSLMELAAKARVALLDLHGVDNAASVDCEKADWDVRVLTRLVLDIERLARGSTAQTAPS